MSGIYIPGMEMPKSCPCELIGIGYDLCCSFVGGIPARLKEYYECCQNDTRPFWCPLIPVPDHGRLIDGDALYEKFLRLESEAMSALQTTSVGSVDGIKWSAILTERTGYKFDIVDAPTVIPASGGSENE